jgi:hypothetical protein
MPEQNGLWAESLRVFKLNAKPVAGYIAAMMVIAFVTEHMSGSAGSSVAQAFAAAILAIPAHLTVLKNASPVTSLLGTNNGKIISPFVLRGIGLGLLAIILPAVAFLVMLFSGLPIAINGIISIVFLLLSAAFVFAKWGTMLPAVALEGDKSMGKASQRGSQIFGYAFPRLLLCFGPLTILLLAPILLVALLFNISEMMFSTETGLDLPLILGVLTAQIIGAFQIVMIAVILSRSYMRAEPAHIQ